MRAFRPVVPAFRPVVPAFLWVVPEFPLRLARQLPPAVPVPLMLLPLWGEPFPSLPVPFPSPGFLRELLPVMRHPL